jgi:ribulose-5-phosphate 4-epimerase/fuculose-1-phosphate aldolase
MCGYMAPGVVSGSEDLIEYYVSDGSTVDPKAKKGYSERFIHGEMFKKFPGVNCVIHSHAEAVLPYVTSGVPLLPVFHMAGFLGKLYNPVIPVSWAVHYVPHAARQTSRYMQHGLTSCRRECSRV